jgi:hypothetical protein
MATTTRVVDLDGAGAGSVHIPPMYFVGASGVTHVENHGNDLGTALLTQASARFVVGPVNVSGGTPDGEASLFFDVK